MRNHIVVLPLDHVAGLYLDGRRSKLKVSDRNLSNNGCIGIGRCISVGECASIGGRIVIGCIVRTPRATEEGATDDDRHLAEQPSPQCSLPGTRPVSYLLSMSFHVCTSFIASWAILPRELRPAVTQVPPGYFSQQPLELICPTKPATFSHVPNERRKLADRFQEDSSAPRS
jgi:hypothetical protein